MKVALIPSINIDKRGTCLPYLPVGLISIRAALRRVNDCDVDLVDPNCWLYRNQGTLTSGMYAAFAEQLVKDRYTLVAFSALSTSFHHIVYLASALKNIEPSILTIVGGPGPQATPLAAELLQRFDCLDYIGQGEGEIVMPALVQALGRPPQLNTVPGLIYRQNERIVINAPAGLIANLAELDMPDISDLDIDLYKYSHNSGEPILRVEQGRGCPFQCSYCSTCSYWQHKIRTKPCSRVVGEMANLDKNYDITSFSLVNDCFNADSSTMTKFLRDYESGNTPYQWGCSVRCDRLTPDIVDHLWNAGCRGLFTGIESGSERIQRLIGKNLNLNHVTTLLQYAVKKGFYIIASFIIGFPEESREDLALTLELFTNCLQIGVTRCDLYVLTPLHGSRLLESGAYPLRFDHSRSSLSNQAILEEQESLIRAYPQIFSAFHYFVPQHVDHHELAEIELFANLLASEFYRESASQMT